MVFKSYKRSEIPEQYKELSISSLALKRLFIKEKIGKEVIVLDSNNCGEYFGGSLMIDNKKEDVYYLIDQNSPEKNTLIFKYENLESIFIKD